MATTIDSYKLSARLSPVTAAIAYHRDNHVARRLREGSANDIDDETSDDEVRGFPGGVSSIAESVAKSTSEIPAKAKERFALVSLKMKADSYLAKGSPTHEVWALVGLGKMSLAAAKQTKQFKIYEKYVKDYDDLADYAALHGKNLPGYSAKDAPEAEIAARAEIWYDSGKSARYVREVLGLRYVKDEELAQHSAYKYLEAYYAFVRKHYGA